MKYRILLIPILDFKNIKNLRKVNLIVNKFSINDPKI